MAAESGGGQGTSGPALRLSDLEANDPQASRGGSSTNRRFLCPLCGEGKKRDASHRSLSVAPGSGLWHCHRCGQRGLLVEFRDAASSLSRAPRVRGRSLTQVRAQAQRAQLSQLQTQLSPIVPPATVVSPPTALPIALPHAELAPGESSAPTDPRANADATPQDEAPSWRARLRHLQPLTGTAGAAYLQGRGIPLEVASLAGVRFCASWFGQSAAVFPIRDRGGTLVAAQGRHTRGAGKLSCGPKSQGVFFAPTQLTLSDGKTRVFHPLDEGAPAILVCEAPIDALSLATCGFPALALCGVNGAYTSGPPWFHLACGLRRVMLAFDNDGEGGPGDTSATALATKLSPFGARCVRLRPEGAKDWNEVLLSWGAEVLSDWLHWQLQI